MNAVQNRLHHQACYRLEDLLIAVKCCATGVAWLYWLVVHVSMIYVALALSRPYRDLEAGDNQSLKFKWRGGKSNPRPLALQAKTLTTLPSPLVNRGGNILFVGQESVYCTLF